MNQSMSSICACMLAAAVCMTAACKDDPYVRPDIPDPAKTTETVGQPLSAWTEGMLDIHFINTTTGECTFIIFPDGTQMLVDAAGNTAETGRWEAHPTSASVPAGTPPRPPDGTPAST